MTDILDDLRLQAKMQREAAEKARRQHLPFMVRPASESSRLAITADWRDDAAKEIDRLRAELAKARTEALEEAAKTAEVEAAYAASRQTCHEVAAAIRALKETNE